MIQCIEETVSTAFSLKVLTSLSPTAKIGEQLRSIHLRLHAGHSDPFDLMSRKLNSDNCV